MGSRQDENKREGRRGEATDLVVSRSEIDLSLKFSTGVTVVHDFETEETKEREGKEVSDAFDSTRLFFFPLDPNDEEDTHPLD